MKEIQQLLDITQSLKRQYVGKLDEPDSWDHQKRKIWTTHYLILAIWKSGFCVGLGVLNLIWRVWYTMSGVSTLVFFW